MIPSEGQFLRERTSSGKLRNAFGNKSASAALGDANRTEQGHRLHLMVVSGTKADEVGMERGIIIPVAARGTTTIVGDTTVAATVGMMIEEATAEAMTQEGTTTEEEGTTIAEEGGTMPEEGAGTTTTTEEERVIMIEEGAGTTIGVEEGGTTTEVEGAMTTTEEAATSEGTATIEVGMNVIVEGGTIGGGVRSKTSTGVAMSMMSAAAMTGVTALQQDGTRAVMRNATPKAQRCT